MKKIVIIGANEFQDPLIKKAEEMGYETHVFAWEDGAVGKETADRFYPISIVEKEKILDICKKIKPDAVATIASDLAGITVNYLARNLGLPCNSERNILISTNKYEMRKALLEAGVPTPEFHITDIDSDKNEIMKMKLPVIVKPTDRSGSRGITRLESWEKLDDAIADAVNNSFENKSIVESYFDGEEYSCECISFKGNHHLLAVTKKFTTGHPHFIETGHLEPSGLNDEVVQKVKTQIFKALDALEIKYGASHSEFKVSENGDINIIEIGARMGGDCIGSDLVMLSTGYDFLKMVIQTASGEQPDLNRADETKTAAIKFIFSQEDFDAYNRIKKDSPEKIYRSSDINVNTGNEIVDSSSRYGFYILTCESSEEVYELFKIKV